MKLRAAMVLAVTSAIEHTPAVRRAMERQVRVHPLCAWCGTSLHPNCHHILPAHLCVLQGKLSLLTDPLNMTTLCRGVANDWAGADNCHWIYGHRRNWSLYDPNVVSVCWTHRRMIAEHYWRNCHE